MYNVLYEGKIYNPFERNFFGRTQLKSFGA